MYIDYCDLSVKKIGEASPFSKNTCPEKTHDFYSYIELRVIGFKLYNISNILMSLPYIKCLCH